METKQLNTPQQTETQNGKAAVLGLQHLLAMYAGAVAVPLLIGTGLNFDSQQMTYLISIDIFMCGVATLLQLTVTKGGNRRLIFEKNPAIRTTKMPEAIIEP